MAGLLAAIARSLTVVGGGRRSRVSRWRLALWALSIALIAGAAGGVRVAEADVVNYINDDLGDNPDGEVGSNLDAEGDLEGIEPDMMVSCYCTAAPPHRW